jgi:hypothetical protein
MKSVKHLELDTFSHLSVQIISNNAKDLLTLQKISKTNKPKLNHCTTDVVIHHEDPFDNVLSFLFNVNRIMMSFIFHV